MRKNRIGILFMLTAAITAAAAPCFSGTLSKSGAIIMKQTMGARQLGMGGAFTAVADDINTLSYNPAGLANLGKIELVAMHMIGLANVSSQFLGASLPTGSLGTFGGSFAMLSAGDIEINTTHDDGSFLNSETKSAQSSILITAGYGMDVSENISAGLAFKIINSTLVETYNASSFAIDIGGLFRPIYEDVTELTIGASLMNLRIGNKMKYLEGTSDEDADELPMAIRGGAMFTKRFGGYYGDSNSVIIAGDVVLPNDSSMKANLGVEGGFEAMNVRIAIRGGMRINDGPKTIALTGGFGVSFSSFQVDFGIGLMGEMGSLIRASFKANFGAGQEEGADDWW